MNTYKNGHEDIDGDEIFPALYVFVFAFHPKVIRDRMIVQRSFGYSLQQFLIWVMFSKIESITARIIEGCCNKS